MLHKNTSCQDATLLTVRNVRNAHPTPIVPMTDSAVRVQAAGAAAGIRNACPSVRTTCIRTATASVRPAVPPHDAK